MATGKVGSGEDRRGENSGPQNGFWEKVFNMAQVPLFVEDVTRVRQAIEEIKASGVKDFGNWLEAHPEFVVATIENLNILEVNDRAVETAGARSHAELVRSLSRMVVPETLESFKEILKAMADGQLVYEGESQYRALDGRSMFTLNRALIPESVEGEPDLLVMASTDITDLRAAQKKLEAEEARYRVLVETSKDVILCHDLNCHILFVNKAGLELTGWTLEQMQDKTLHDIIPERMHQEMDERLEKRVQGFGGTFLFEIFILDRHGNEIPVEISTNRIGGEFNESPQVLATMRNVSERKALESRILDTQKMESLGALAGGIAHDFNNLLATIMGNAEMIRGEDGIGSEFDENLESILEASAQAADLCQQMLTYSGKGRLSVDNGNLTNVVNEVSRLLQATVSGRARLNLQLAENLPSVMVDPVSIRQVVMGLVSNAAEAMGDEGGEVVIRTGVSEFSREQLLERGCTPILNPGRYCYCEVADSGTGMEKETLRRLFDPFFSTKMSGRGLGLSAALGIMKGHGGGFLIETKPQVGTTVSFLLPEAPQPVKKQPRRRKKAPDTLHQDLAGKLVLLVDEDPPVRQVCEGYLRRLGCSVLSVGNGPDSVRIFSQRFSEVDLVILDLSMAEMDGVATFRRLRVIHPEVPVIFSTGFGQEELDQRAEGLGDYGYISKPFKLASVRLALAQALGKIPD